MKVFTPDRQAELLERLPQATGLRDLAREMGVDYHTLHSAAEPYIAILRAQGVLAPCPCGKERFHPHGCAVRGSGGRGRTYRSGEEHQAMLHRRALFVSMLVDGARFVDIDAAMCSTKGTARSYARHLTEEQRQTRAAAIERREREDA